MADSKDDDSEGTPKNSRKATKKESKKNSKSTGKDKGKNVVGSFFNKILKKSSKHCDNSSKAPENLAADVNLDVVEETNTLTHFERARPPTNRRRPARVPTKRAEVSDTSKSTNSPPVLDDKKVTAVNTLLPNPTNPLPPVPNKGTRPRINTISKDPRKASLDKSIDISSDQEEIFSQTPNVSRSNSQKTSEPPAIPPSKLKPRSNSFSQSEDSIMEDTRENHKASTIMEEDEDIMGMEVGNRELSERFIPSGPRLSKSRSLSVYDDKKSSMLKNNIRALTFAAETDNFADDMIDNSKENENLTEETYVAHSDSMPTRNVGVKSFGQRLSFQGIEYYHREKNRNNPHGNNNVSTRLSGNEKYMNRSKTVAGSQVPEHDTKYSKSRCLDDNFIQKSNFKTKQDLKPQFSIQNDTNEAASTSTSVILPFKTKLIDGNSTETSSDSNVATNLMEKSVNHSRYCCDNIPVA